MYIAEITCMVALLLNNKAIFSITTSIDSDDFRSAWLAVKTIRKHGPMKHDASIPLAHLAKSLCVAPGCYKHLGNLHWLCDTVIFPSWCYLPRFGALPHIQWSDVPSVLSAEPAGPWCIAAHWGRRGGNGPTANARFHKHLTLMKPNNMGWDDR